MRPCVTLLIAIALLAVLLPGAGEATAAEWACPPHSKTSGLRVDWGMWIGTDACQPPVYDDYRGPFLSDVVSGGPGFVAIGSTEGGWASYTSADGLRWSEHALSFMAQGVLVARRGTVVLVGSGLAAASADGATWRRGSRSPASTATISAATGDGPRLVAVGRVSTRQGQAWTSADGLTWTAAARQAAMAGMCPSAVAGRTGGYVAVGTDCAASSPRAVVVVSRDGRTWRRAPVQAAFAGLTRLTVVVPGGPGFIAVGDYRPVGGSWGSAFWTSRDGLSWRRVGFYRRAVPGQAILDIHQTGEGYVALGQSSPRDYRYAPLAWFSPDGAHWARDGWLPTLWLDSDSSVELTGSAAASGRIVAVGSFYDAIDIDVRPYGSLLWNGVVQPVGPD